MHAMRAKVYVETSIISYLTARLICMYLNWFWRKSVVAIQMQQHSAYNLLLDYRCSC